MAAETGHKGSSSVEGKLPLLSAPERGSQQGSGGQACDAPSKAAIPAKEASQRGGGDEGAAPVLVVDVNEKTLAQVYMETERWPVLLYIAFNVYLCAASQWRQRHLTLWEHNNWDDGCRTVVTFFAVFRALYPESERAYNAHGIAFMGGAVGLLLDSLACVCVAAAAATITTAAAGLRHCCDYSYTTPTPLLLP